MTFEVQIHGSMLKFEDAGRGLRADSVRTQWASFRCENSRADLTGENVRFILVDENGWPQKELVHEHCVIESIKWFEANEPRVREACIKALLKYIDEVLIKEYLFDEPEILGCKTADNLEKLVDLSYVRFFPHSKDGIPYFSLEFECSWDPEHGCGVMLNGEDVIDIGGSDSSQSSASIVDHGGEI